MSADELERSRPRAFAFLRRRAMQRGVEISELLAPPERVYPDIMASLRSKAEKSGRSVGDLLEGAIQGMEAAPYPGPNCWLPEEVEQYCSDAEVPDERLTHLAVCGTCRILVTASARDLDPTFEEAFDDVIRYAIAIAKTGASAKEDSSIPAVEKFVSSQELLDYRRYEERASTLERNDLELWSTEEHAATIARLARRL